MTQEMRDIEESGDTVYRAFRDTHFNKSKNTWHELEHSKSAEKSVSK